MRLLHVMVLVAALQIPQDQLGTIEGIVTQAGTSYPVAGVHLTLREVGRNNQSLPVETDATTNGAGVFAFTGVTPGPYALEVSSEDYMFGEMPVSSPTTIIRVVVSPGQRLKVPPITAVRAASIRGQVLDADGRGLADMPVEILFSTINPQGGVVWRQILGRDARTDEKGEYRRSQLGPGQYVVRTTLERPDTPNRLVYAPGTTDANSALIVDLRGGSEVTADIRIAPAVDAGTYKVSGKVTAPGREPVSLVLRRRPVESDPLFALEGSPRTFTDADRRSGRFEFRNTRAGIYDLYATTNVEGKEYLTKTVVEVRNTDVDDLDLALHPAVDIEGRVVFDGEPRDLRIRGSSLPDDSRDPNRSHIGDIGIALRRTDGLLSDPLARVEVDDDGVSFAFRNISEGDYEFTINFLADEKPPSPDLYVADIRAGGRSVIDTGFQVGVDDVDAMEVVIGTQGGSIKGTVVGRRPGTAGFLVIAPATVREGTQLYDAIPITINGSDQFEFQGLRPGRYRILAIAVNGDFILPRIAAPNGVRGPKMMVGLPPEFFVRNGGIGVTVTVTKGNTTSGVRVPMASSR